MNQVDNFLRGNICTFHQIMKNSVLKQINKGNLLLHGGEAKSLKEELCYFKNLTTSTRR